MSELQSPQESIGTFVGGCWNVDGPPNEIQTSGYRPRPSWPFLSDKRELQVLCVFLITSRDLEKSAITFLDAASTASKNTEYFCNPTVIVESRNGKVACTLEVTRQARGSDARAGDLDHSPASVAQRRALGDQLTMQIAMALLAAGYENLNQN